MYDNGFFFQEFYLAKFGYKPNMNYNLKINKLVSYIHGYILKTKY
jgi:hypothetical protein